MSKKYSILGQHFLNSASLAARIARIASIDNEVVVEIGSGKGILTRQLAEYAKRVIAVEIDSRWADFLKGLHIPRVEILNRDFLRIDLAGFDNPVVVGNIPYLITSAIIKKLALNKSCLKHAVLTLQREYGDKMTAALGSADYGYVSVFVNHHFTVHKQLTIPARYFTPRPQINSTVVTLKPKRSVCNGPYEKGLFEFIAGVFRYRRKSLKNAIMSHLRALPDGLDPALLAKRPQHLSFDDFEKTYRYILTKQ